MSLLRLLKLRPIVASFIFRVLLTVLLDAKILKNLFFHGIVLLKTDLGLLDLALELLNPTLVIILLLDRRPELATRLSQREEQWLTTASR